MSIIDHPRRLFQEIKTVGKINIISQLECILSTMPETYVNK